MADILRFPFEPFVWLWTALILGFIIALPDTLSKRFTARDNIGIYVVVAGGLFALMFTGIVDFDAARRSGPLVNVMRYILHPLTIGWTLILVGIIIALPDTMTDRILSQDKFGYYLVAGAALALVLGIGVIRLDQFISFQLFLGIVIGAALIVGFQYLTARRATNTPTEAPTRHRVTLVTDESGEEEAAVMVIDPDDEPDPFSDSSDLPSAPTA